MKEIWKPIPGYEGIYELNNYGHLKRLERITYVPAKNIYITLKERIRKMPKAPKRKYRFYALLKDGIRWNGCVHKLLAMCFLENDDPLNKTQVNHIDGNKTNDALYNLEWCTPGENLKHAWNTGLRKKYLPGEAYNCRKVLNTKTGEIYPSISYLANTISMNRNTLKNKLYSIKNDSIYQLI